MKQPNEVNVEAGEIIAAIKAGQRDAVEQLYDRYRASFLVWAVKRFFITQGDIEDAWQEAAVIFYDQVMAGRLTTLTCTVKTFLFAVGGKWLLKNERKLKRIWWKDEMDEALMADIPLVDYGFNDVWEEERLLLSAAMTALSPQCREVLTQRHYHDRSIAEIMEDFKYANRNTVTATLAGCLAKLKSIIQEKTKK